jgi:hypothetical protein
MAIMASDLADRPWIPITAAVVIVTCVVVAVWRSAWVALAALVGALVGAVAFLPVGYVVKDGPPGCQSCGEYITVLMGASFRVPYNGPFAASVGAAVLGVVFALVAWGFLRRTRG